MLARPAGSQKRDERDLFAYLLTNVRHVGECKVWAGTLCSDGYPRIMVGRKARRARRLMVEMLCSAYGEPLPATARVYARACCEHPKSCMSMEHLLIGSQQQAVDAAVRRGRYLTGPQRAIATARGRAAISRMPMSECRNVTAKLAAGASRRDVADEYGITTNAVSSALRRWRRMGLIEG